ncbi:hypothetical protein SRHO_G00276260 [Serrasalmus rhombeus]
MPLPVSPLSDAPLPVAYFLPSAPKHEAAEEPVNKLSLASPGSPGAAVAKRLAAYEAKRTSLKDLHPTGATANLCPKASEGTDPERAESSRQNFTDAAAAPQGYRKVLTVRFQKAGMNELKR